MAVDFKIESPHDGDSVPKEGFDATGHILPAGGHHVTGEIVKNGAATNGRTIDPDNPWKIHFPALGGTLATGGCNLNVECNHCDVTDGIGLNVNFRAVYSPREEKGRIDFIKELLPGVVLVYGRVDPPDLNVYGKIIRDDSVFALGKTVLLFGEVWAIAFTGVQKGKNQWFKLKAEHGGKILAKARIDIP